MLMKLTPGVGDGGRDSREDARSMVRLVRRRQGGRIIPGSGSGELHRRRDGKSSRTSNALAMKFFGSQILFDDVVCRLNVH